MFKHRPSKLALRKEFEQRMWQPGESFTEYYHDKIILANRISIDNDEIIDYILDGVPNPRLRDQTRLQQFKEMTELIEAFENITLRSKPKFERGTSESLQKSNKENRPTTSENTKGPLREAIKCYNCKEKGHRAAACPNPRINTSEPNSEN